MADDRKGIISRRQFIAVSAVAGGGVLLAMSPLGKRVVRKFTPKDPSIYVKILPNDRVVITIPKSELGQGVRTSLAMLIAEELDADWQKVLVETASYDPKYEDQGTGGSGSVMSRFKQFRQIGATGRAMLIAAAARQWDVSDDDIVTERSVVRHSKSGETLTYGALANSLRASDAPAMVKLKPRSEWRIMGKPQIGRDVAEITHGTAKYGIDIRVPNMRFASIERTREFGATVKSFDASAAMKVPGVLQVVETKPVPGSGVHAGVAVIATNTWAAMQGRRALKIEWTSGRFAAENSNSYREFMRNAVEKTGAEVVNKNGDPDAVIARSSKVIRADYELPFVAHTTMEPMNCTAHAAGDRVEIWSPTQFPDWAAGNTASVLGIPPANVTLHVVPLIGGGFGRRINPDFTVEAALLSKQINAPVQVLWTREDDIGHDFYRPCAWHRIDATLDANGFPEAWRHRMSTAAISASGGRSGDKNVGVGESNGASDMSYRIPNRSCEYTLLPSGVPRGWWRAVHTTHTTFAVESFIDELAAAANKDPLEYRLALIDKYSVSTPPDDKYYPFNPDRLKGVLRLAAEKAGWGKPLPPGHAHGIACALDHLSYAAEVVEVSVDNGKLRVHKVVVAADCGPVVNPDGARAQLEGGVTQALSVALKERITISAGGVDQRNFNDYQLLRINQAPITIESYFVDRDSDDITGLGEPSVPPLAPALANAIARATGKRLRVLPLEVSSSAR
jgi:isoquinoline 1-oxidoreductase subunit beta